jgi:hypothetical protein
MTADDARAALQSALWSAFEHACVYSDSDTAERLSAIIMKVGKGSVPSRERHIPRRVRGRPDHPA